MMKGISYPRTTVAQRKKLFQVWEETKDVGKACLQARVSERTFYYWKPRFEAGGYEALEQFGDHRPKNPARTAPEVEQQVIEMRQAQPSWGKRRIADELAKSNNWIPLVSPNTVRRILQEVGLWSVSQQSGQKKSQKG
jgi:transposase